MSRGYYNSFINITDNGGGLYLDGATLSSFTTHTITNWSVNGHPLLYRISDDNFTVSGNYGEVILVDCQDANVTGMNITSKNPITFAFCDRAVVKGIDLHSTSTGIRFEFSENCTVSDVFINEANDGVYLDHSSSIRITGLTAESSVLSGQGVYIADTNGIVTVDNSSFRGFNYGVIVLADGSLIENVSVFQSRYGICLNNQAEHGTVQYCNLNDSSSFGMLVRGENNTVTNNTIQDSGAYGFRSMGGQWNTIAFNEIFGCSNYGAAIDSNSENNTFHHNNFYDNGGSASQASDDGWNNIWDDGVDEGNYWDDWDGNGTYSIAGSASAEDRYPLCDPVDNDAPEKIPEFGLLFVVSMILISLIVFGRRR